MSDENVIFKTVYLEIEYVEWLENTPEGFESIFRIKGEKQTQTICAIKYEYNIIKLLNEYSRQGWKVINFSDTFIRLNSGCRESPSIDMLQRIKCYLLSCEMRASAKRR